MADFDELVRTEAYLIWEAEGRPHGEHDRHWRMAVERVRSQPPVQPGEDAEAVVVPVPLKRVVLLPRARRKPQDDTSRIASA